MLLAVVKDLVLLDLHDARLEQQRQKVPVGVIKIDFGIEAFGLYRHVVIQYGGLKRVISCAKVDLLRMYHQYYLERFAVTRHSTVHRASIVLMQVAMIIFLRALQHDQGVEIYFIPLFRFCFVEAFKHVLTNLLLGL